MLPRRLSVCRGLSLRRRLCGSQQGAWLPCAALPPCTAVAMRDFAGSALLQPDRRERRRIGRFLFSHRGAQWALSLLPSCRGYVTGGWRSLRGTRGGAADAAPRVLRSAQPGGDGKNNSEEESDGGAVAADDGGNEDALVERSVLFVLVMFLLSYVLYRLAQPSGKRTGWASLMKHADAVESVHLYQNYAQVQTEEAKVFLGLVDDQHTQEKLERLREACVTAKVKKQQTQKEPKDAAKPTGFTLAIQGTPLAEHALVGLGVFAWVIPFVFFPVFVMILSNSIGKAVATTMEAGKRSQRVKDMVFRLEHTSNTRFHDIAGMQEAKREITEVVDFLRQPERYTALGAKIPTGALLLGPPGTGKTLLAKAVAGEGGVGFIPVCGSDFVELYVGMGALRVRQLFETAKKQRCVVYIDEIDAIGLKRSGAGHGEKQEQEHTLNELLTQLDGFGSGKRGDVMILASSNVPQEMLDPALIRPGRFDRIIHVDTPVISERIDIFKVHLSGLKLLRGAGEAAGGDAARAPVDAASTEAAAETTTTKAAKAAGEAETTGRHAAQEQRGAAAEHAAETAGGDRNASEATAADAVSNQKAPSSSSSSSSPAATAEASTVKESALIVSTLQRELDEEKQRLQEEESLFGYASFDFRSLLAKKSEAERALINAYAERLCGLCPGFVGADIANVCNEGAILAAREGCKYVDITHLERSIDRVLAGIEHRSRVLTAFERNVVAHHEAGHAVAGWFLHRADPLMKVSIVPRGGSALGYAQYLPNENRMRTATEIRDAISVTLGGRVAEKIFFNHLSTGASDDLRKVTLMAYQYVSSFAERPVYPAPGTPGTRLVKPFGPKVSNELDVEAKKFVDEVYESTYQLLRSKKAEMEILAKHLLEKEVLTYDDVVGYLGVRRPRLSDRKKLSEEGRCRAGPGYGGVRHLPMSPQPCAP
ncbi:putative ATP-dependent zinc metallopeptidase, putative,metallo-peptidase, clan MA(E), family M41 [Trypanosoma conorhini]|uniref:Putative ATP-dependent zinc metallopeptidase, putative,metallo-peptidase, clan MA(E), family M41 n=1 Tax=Trypanosoma conorhini TaxID=83891 RepID=A0A3R7L093_9TRYP|nr:putative ATP-dependent zinc metallopeptidase, putative,metallo-peptidase, clan MA(E), family M41 [Trypanosoma conorhini]RNF18545.1 putative ATP-dependent zinc metallopeptidase, putative,metallo-peptidase, clan MA(E), family M41 [Trypanosoma conorhini]